MKYLKILLLGLITFAAPIVFYMQALQQENEKKQSDKQGKNQDSVRLALYREFIKDSITLHMLRDSIARSQHERPGTSNTTNFDKILSRLDTLNKNYQSLSRKVDTAIKQNNLILTEFKNALINLDSLFNDFLDRYKTNSNPFPETYYYNGLPDISIASNNYVRPFEIPKSVLKDNQFICIHIDVENSEIENYKFNFPNNDSLKLSVFICRDYEHKGKNNKPVDERDIPHFHTKVSNKSTVKLPVYAIYIPLNDTTRKELTIPVTLSTNKTQETNKNIIIKFN